VWLVVPTTNAILNILFFLFFAPQKWTLWTTKSICDKIKQLLVRIIRIKYLIKVRVLVEYLIKYLLVRMKVRIKVKYLIAKYLLVCKNSINKYLQFTYSWTFKHLKKWCKQN